MLRVEIKDVVVTNAGLAVLLRAESDPRTLPIFVGPAEAEAIAIRLNDVTLPRPLTHDLMRRMLEALSGTLKQVEICDLSEGTFYAELVIDQNGNELRIDARPSDAMALALRCEVPVFVDEQVWAEAGRDMAAAGAPDAFTAGEARADGESPSALAALKSALELAIKEERYEEAARLRDAIAAAKPPDAS